MRKIVLYIASSLDGKIAGENDNLDWLPHIEDGDDDYGYSEMYDSVDTLIMGYRTYEICRALGDWPYAGKKVYVFTRDGNKPCIDEVELITEDPVTFTRNLQQAPGKNIWLVGGGEINRQMHDAELIDEYIITIVPHILGKGIDMLPAIIRQQKLILTKHKTYDNGLAMMYYTNNNAT